MYDAIGVWKKSAEIDAYSAAHGGKPVTLRKTNCTRVSGCYKDVNNDGVFDKDNDRGLFWVVPP